MSQVYNEYINDHMENVQKAYRALIGFIPDLPDKLGLDPLAILCDHDKSKWSSEEYDAYDKYFYGKTGRSSKIVEDFKYAWLHHIHNNPHHWQYWILLNDDEGEEVLEMPSQYVVEMICDWWSFSYAKGDMTEIFSWYKAHKDKMKLHPKTRKLVEDILGKLAKSYDVEFVKDDHLEHYGIKGQKWGVKNGPPYPLKPDKIANNVYEEAKEHVSKITDDVTYAANFSGSKLYGLENRLKTKESIERKIIKNSHEDSETLSDSAENIKDAVRFTTLSNEQDYVDNYRNFKKALENEGYSETRCKNYFDLFNQGKVKHKSVQSTFKTKDGYEFEVQFHTEASQNAKNKKLPLYNERRQEGIDPERAKELERQMEELALNVKDPVGIESIESHGEKDSFKTPEKLSEHMKTFKYKNFDKLMSADEVEEQKAGSCHDQVMYELRELRRMGKEPKALFMLENDGKRGGDTHSLVYYPENGYLYWFENAFAGQEGLHRYESLNEIKDDIHKLHRNGEYGNIQKFPEIEFGDFDDSKLKIGDDLQAIVDKCLE